MDTIPLQYPVVLVHGIYAHDRKGGAKFWGRIPDTLRSLGIEVFFGNTDAWGEYESNAAVLKKTIEEILKGTKKEKVNIIAHSKGGIDCRYLIWKYHFGDKVASLTTICSPHRGAEIADLLFTKKIIHTNLSKKILKTYGKLYGDTNPNLYNVNKQLTTTNMEEFNKNVHIDSSVYFQSLYTTMNDPRDEPILSNSYLYIKKTSGDNDGLVSEVSAKWGNITRKIHSGISHIEVIDIKKRTISGISIPGIYVDIVRDLQEKGF